MYGIDLFMNCLFDMLMMIELGELCFESVNYGLLISGIVGFY